MSSIRSYSRRAGSLFAVAALVLATITPGLIPSFASAAQLTERSIELSSSSADADNVNYKLTFTPAAAAGALVVDFCSNSPLIEAACDVPAGFSAAGAASADATNITATATNLIIEKALTATETVINVTGINNPTNSGPLYARLTTYTDAAAVAAQYSSPTDVGDAIDDGAVAISITKTIGVSGAVLESMTFCVAGPGRDGNDDPIPTTITDGCGGSLPAPVLKLGKKTGTVIALDSSEVSTGSLYSQISTNASKGAIVNLKSNAAGCGGLKRAGAPTACDIAPAQATDITDGQAKFGAKVNPTAGGTGTLVGLTGYNASTFVLNYNATDQSTGVTSTYGDPFFSTSDLPASNKNLEITFGASVAPNTPAGLYSAELSLIATGKF